MKFNIDGGCRRNGRRDAIGAAAAVLYHPFSTWCKTMLLPETYYAPHPSSQRAELTALIIALEWVLEKYEELNGYPRLDVEIRTDSKYVIGCMNTWIYKWTRNGWKNAAGYSVVNQDLIQKASDLDDKVAELGCVRYTWVPRSENEDADGYCNKMMDEM